MAAFLVQKPNQIKPYPFKVYFFTVFVLATLGLLDSLYMSVSHYRVYVDIGYKSFCAISRAINCDTVSESPYSIFLGIPVPIWGVVGYSIFLLFFPFIPREGDRKVRLWSLLLIIALVFSLLSIVFAIISAYFIKSYCIMCILSYAVNFSLLLTVWILRRRFDTDGLFLSVKKDFGYLWSKRKKTVPTFVPVLAVVAIMIAFFPDYWHLTPPPPSVDLPQGVTEDGHPWIGAEDPEITIVEFTDYECFQCKKMHYFLRQILTEKPDRLRLVHRHFPMDHKFNPIVEEPYHVGAGYMALIALYAQEKGKFWLMNDLLYTVADDPEGVGLRALAKKTGLDFEDLKIATRSIVFQERLYQQIKKALRMGVYGTPAFEIDGEVYSAMIPSEIIKRLLK